MARRITEEPGKIKQAKRGCVIFFALQHLRLLRSPARDVAGMLVVQRFRSPPRFSFINLTFTHPESEAPAKEPGR
jgi:hypothetical protein